MAKQPDEYEFSEKLSFVAEWFDQEVAFHKNFILNYFPYDNTVELFDVNTNRMYLKRTKLENRCMDDLYLGNTLRIYGRNIKILDYADCRTKNLISKTKENAFLIIKPALYDKLGIIINELYNRGFIISRLKMCLLTRKEALDYYEHKKSDSFLPFILEHVTSGRLVAAELIGDNGRARIIEELGPIEPVEARQKAPNSLRAIYGIDRQLNGFSGTYTAEEAARSVNFFFSTNEKKILAAPLQLENTTCCVIKPHVIQEKQLGNIISYICKHEFKVTALKMIALTSAQADEFLEVYKGVVSDYHQLLMSYLTGPCVALEIASEHKEMNVHQEFRKFCGPRDPDIARQIRPDTIRAVFGMDNYNNAVHCTDLPEDTKLELEYLFRILT